MSLQISSKSIDTADTNVKLENGNNRVSIAEGFVIIDKETNNIGSSTNSMNRIIKEGDQPLVRSEMDKALDVLSAIEKACDAQTKAQLNLDQKTQHVGAVKNLFYKFLGLFSKSLETEKRTQALNAKLHSVAIRLKDDKNLYNGVLLSTLNDPELEAPLKTTCFKLYDGDPETQDKLFKSLKEPPKEIREQFWERHKEKILDGSILKEFFGIENLVAHRTQDNFVQCVGNPLKDMVFSALLLLPDNGKFMEKNCSDIQAIIFQNGVIGLLEDKDDLQKYLRCYTNLINTPGYMGKWDDELKEAPKEDETLLSLKNKVSGIKDFFSGAKKFDEISSLGLGTKDVLADLDREPPANGSIKFNFGSKGSIELNTVMARGKSKKEFFEDIKKRVTDLGLDENEISRLADFLGVAAPQGLFAPLKLELGIEEHSFKLNVSFEKEQTKITMPLKDEPVKMLTGYLQGNIARHFKNKKIKDLESFQDKLKGNYMDGTMEIIAKGTTMINAETKTTFRDFYVRTPDL